MKKLLLTTTLAISLVGCGKNTKTKETYINEAEITPNVECMPGRDGRDGINGVDGKKGATGEDGIVDYSIINENIASIFTQYGIEMNEEFKVIFENFKDYIDRNHENDIKSIENVITTLKIDELRNEVDRLKNELNRLQEEKLNDPSIFIKRELIDILNEVLEANDNIYSHTMELRTNTVNQEDSEDIDELESTKLLLHIDELDIKFDEDNITVIYSTRSVDEIVVIDRARKVILSIDKVMNIGTDHYEIISEVE